MLYSDIDLYMQRAGFDKEPAFEYLHFLTEPIESPDDRRILGLYYPEGEEANKGIGYLPPSTIILPSDASEGTLLHELGHRYGHFYYNDLSEAFAENFRKRYQKEGSMKMVAFRNLPAVGRSEDWAAEGVDFIQPPTTLKVGERIQLAMDGTITNLTEGIFSTWQVAVVVYYTNPGVISSKRVYHNALWGDKIYLFIPFETPFDLGLMPNKNIVVTAVVYANREGNQTFSWIPPDFTELWNGGWDYVTSLNLPILLDTAPPGGGTGMQLYQQASTDAAKTYRGKAETAVFTFSTGPEQIDFINNFFVTKFVGECVKAIQQKSPGDQLLFLQLYRDASSALRTNYELHLTATDISGNPLPWTAIIIVALAIIATYLVINPVLTKVIDLFWGPADEGGKRPGPLSNPLVILGVAGAALLGIALVKSTSVKSAVTGKG